MTPTANNITVNTQPNQILEWWNDGSQHCSQWQPVEPPAAEHAGVMVVFIQLALESFGSTL